VSAANSLVGSNISDQVSSSGVTALSNGNYLVRSGFWDGGRGAVTWASGTSGQTLDSLNIVTPQNSLLGPAANAGMGFSQPVDAPSDQAYVVGAPLDGTGRVVSGFVNPSLLTYSRGQSQTVTITPALLSRTLNAGGAVVLQASNDITINSPITV